MNQQVPIYLKPIEKIGKVVSDLIGGLGEFTTFNFKVLFWMFKAPYRPGLFFEQMYFVGNKSLLIILMTSIFSGMVFAYQTYLGFQVINGDSLVGPVVAISIAKELAPVFTGIVVAGRCGSAMAAQIGTMKVTEQVDALEVMGINSIQYLAVPRVIASALSLPMLCAIYILVANLGSYLIGVKALGIDETLFFSKVSEFMDYKDVIQGLIKAFIFGYLVSMIGTFHGFKVSGGAEGVGKGTNMAVVWGMVTVLVLDFFLTTILVKVL
ncbi:ABC transporter permease [Bacteriovoracaceae bacterium]|nr:ABC transporter permease [Bacteriovoracaceae bacterium]